MKRKLLSDTEWPGQALNLKDNNINVIVGQRKGTASWEQK